MRSLYSVCASRLAPVQPSPLGFRQRWCGCSTRRPASSAPPRPASSSPAPPSSSPPPASPTPTSSPSAPRPPSAAKSSRPSSVASAPSLSPSPSPRRRNPSATTQAYPDQPDSSLEVPKSRCQSSSPGIRQQRWRSVPFLFRLQRKSNQSRFQSLNCSRRLDQQFPSHPRASPVMANSLLRRPASGSTRWDSLALLGDDLDESASKFADDVLPTIHPSFSSDMGASGIWVQPECVTKRLASVSHQLRFVNLFEIPEGYDLSWTLFILEAVPSLEELYLTVWDHPCKMETDEKRSVFKYSENKGVDWESSVSHFQQHSLATFTIFGFQSEEYMVSYLRRVSCKRR